MYEQKENDIYTSENSVEDCFYSREENSDDYNQQVDLGYGNSERYKNLKVPIWVVIFLVVIFAINIVCMVRFPKTLTGYKNFKTAETRMALGETSMALTDLFNLVEEYPTSVPIIMKSIKLAMENGYYDMAGYLYNEHLVGLSLSDSEYASAYLYLGRLERYYKTFDAVTEIFNNIEKETLEDSDYENIKFEIIELLKEQGHDNALIYYYLGLIEPERLTGIEYLEKSYNMNPEMLDVRVQLGILYRRVGNYSKAKQLNEEALNKDNRDTNALRSKAILEMLDGNIENALGYAKNAYDIYAEGNYIRDTYLIALYLNGMETEMKIIEAEIISTIGSLDEETIKLLNGEISLVDYYVGG